MLLSSTYALQPANILNRDQGLLALYMVSILKSQALSFPRVPLLSIPFSRYLFSLQLPILLFHKPLFVLFPCPFPSASSCSLPSCMLSMSSLFLPWHTGGAVCICDTMFYGFAAQLRVAWANSEHQCRRSLNPSTFKYGISAMHMSNGASASLIQPSLC